MLAGRTCAAQNCVEGALAAICDGAGGSGEGSLEVVAVGVVVAEEQVRHVLRGPCLRGDL